MTPADAAVTSNERQSHLLARNVALDYVAIGVDLLLGAVMLPFNVAHLGPAAYGLFVLTTSITTYFSMLDLGYGSAQVKFAAQYRALGNPRALNEISSTLFFLFLGVAAAGYAAAVVVASNIDLVLDLAPDQVAIATSVLLIVSLYAALGLPFSIFGGVTNGFQRFYLNNLISIVTSVAVALATVVVLTMGYGLVELVAVTTSIRLAALFAYRRTAYRVFPGLSIRWKYVRAARLREVTSFSAFLLIIEIAMKINFTADTVVIGAFLGTAAIAVWAVGARLILAVRSLSTVLSRFLFPVIVDSAVRGRDERVRAVLVQGTRLSLAAVTPLAAVLALLAGDVVDVWVGPGFEESVAVIRILAAVVIIRIGTSTSYSVLKGAGRHRFAAACSLTTALSNLALSIVLVRVLGLSGVALGTLIPVTVAAICFVFPAACRRAGIPLLAAVRSAVWPALWPAVPAGAVVLAVQNMLTPGLAMIVISSLFGGAVYLATFVSVALRRDERRWYVRKLGELVRLPSSVTTSW